MVYLKFPIPRSLDSTVHDVNVYLPHALRTLDHLEELGILNDATVGAELSHLAASALTWNGGLVDAEHSYTAAMIAKYYRQAVTGYFYAWKRLEALPQITRSRVVNSTAVDYSDEVHMAEYTHYRYSSGYERFGYSAPWRCLQSMYRLVTTLMALKQLDEALKYVLQLIELNAASFGADENETIKAIELSMNIYHQQGEWEKAYDAALRKAKGKMRLGEIQQFQGKEADKQRMIQQYGGLIRSEEGGGLAYDCGACASKIRGKERTALIWYQIYLMAREHVYGCGVKECSRAMCLLGLAYEKVNDLPASIFWLSEGVDAKLADKDANNLLEVNQNKWDAMAASDPGLDEYIGEFRRVLARIKEEGVVLAPRLEYLVNAVEGWSGLWDIIKPVVPLGPCTERVFPDEEYDPYVEPKLSYL